MQDESKEYIIEYRKQFFKDYNAHKKAGTKSVIKKVHALIEELKKHPTSGTGKPEELKGNLKGQWSRRINGEHRLNYRIDDNIVTVIVISCYGHYGDK